MSPVPQDLDSVLDPRPLIVNSAQPVFIAGCVRSGTSAMARVMRDGAELAGFNEGNIFSMMQRMLNEVGKQFQNVSPELLARKQTLMLANTSREAVETYVTNYFVAMYMKHRPEPRW